MPALDRFSPECLLISAGFDAAGADDVASINLEASTFGWMTARLAEWADSRCSGRLISVLEGGYDLPSLSRGVVAHVRAMMQT